MKVKSIVIRRIGENKSRVSFVTDSKEISVNVNKPVDKVRECKDKILKFAKDYLSNINEITRDVRKELKNAIIDIIDNGVKDKNNKNVESKVIDLLYDYINSNDIDSELIGAVLMAFGDALSYLKKYNIEAPIKSKVYIGEGYDYKNDKYVYIIVTPEFNVELEVE